MPHSRKPRIELHLPEELLARIEAWRLSQPMQPNRTMALHHLINRGLEAVANDPTYAPVRPPTKP